MDQVNVCLHILSHSVRLQVVLFCTRGIHVFILEPELPPSRLFNIARKPYTKPQARHDLGPMDLICAKCGAFHWTAEQLAKTKLFGACCNSGQVQLTTLTPPPRALLGLYTGDDPIAREFRDHITQYNAAHWVLIR